MKLVFVNIMQELQRFDSMSYLTQPPISFAVLNAVTALPAPTALCLVVTGCQSFNYTDEDLAREHKKLAEGYASGGWRGGMGNINLGNSQCPGLGGGGCPAGIGGGVCPGK